MIDFHAHLLPGLDDGAATLEEALAMAGILRDVGCRVVHCTPHLRRGGFETSPATVRRGVHRFQEALGDAGIALQLVAGTEHFMDSFLPQYLPEAVTVDGSRYILLEAPLRCEAESVLQGVAAAQQLGLSPLIAHPERCGAFSGAGQGRGFFSRFLARRGKEAAEGSLPSTLKAAGCRFQGNLGSFAGFYGATVQRAALRLLEEGVYDCVGSDAHTPHALEAVLLRGVGVVVDMVGKEAAAALFTPDFLPPPAERHGTPDRATGTSQGAAKV